MSRRLSILIPLCLVVAQTAVGQANLPPLVEAAKERDWDGLRALLSEGADPNGFAVDGETALHWVAYWDDIEIAELLIDAGADADVANDLGATPLFNAALNRNAEMTRLLLEAGASPDAALMSGETPLMTAARTGDPGVLELLVEAGADPDVRATRGQTALMWAAAQRHREAVRVLTEHGADVHARSESWTQVMAVPPHSNPSNQKAVPHGGNTALLFAARVGDLASAKILVEAGADLDAADAWGVTPTVLAAHSGYRELVEYLLEEGADPSLDGAGFSALHLAVMRRDAELARTLLEHGADPDPILETWTPTRRASRDWHFHQSLVGATPFWIAARFSEPEIMRLLADHGADPHFVHESSYTAGAGNFGAADTFEATTTLMAAVGMGGPRRLRAFIGDDPSDLEARALEAVRIAVELGVDVHATDLEGRTAADRAGFPSIQQFLAPLSQP